jgi:hypothetical protein
LSAALLARALGSDGGAVCSWEVALAGGCAGVGGLACCAKATVAAAIAVKANSADVRFTGYSFRECTAGRLDLPTTEAISPPPISFVGDDLRLNFSQPVLASLNIAGCELFAFGDKVRGGAEV